MRIEIRDLLALRIQRDVAKDREKGIKTNNTIKANELITLGMKYKENEGKINLWL